MPPIRILIADDHTLMRQGLRQLCGRQGGFTVVGEAVTGAQAVALARDARPDVILMDIVMPELDGVEAIRQIVREAPGTRIIALTMYREEPYMLAAIRAGARGYLLKPVDAGDLVAAIEAVYRGDYVIDPIIAARVLGELHMAMPDLPRVEPLTGGEMAVLRLVAQGVDNKDISRALHCSVFTVSNRLRTTVRGPVQFTNNPGDASGATAQQETVDDGPEPLPNVTRAAASADCCRSLKTTSQLTGGSE
jgi:DNA-binding NarL/FixJ family response regulator